jgi:glyoxylase-like metal-dependent hydrolase (beta-lactamase superfamily II)
MSTRTLTLGAIVAVGALFIALAAGQASGQAGQAPGPTPGQTPPAALTIEQVKPGLYAILNPGANTLAVRVTSEGVVLVDDMFERNYEQIIEKIRTVTNQPVRYVISTHHHGDHTGSNLRFLGASAEVIGHKNARAHMVSAAPAMPGPPRITFTTETALHLGGVEIEVHHVGRGHTDGDAIVYFPDLKVMATGDLFVVLPRVPTIDYANGGTTLGWPKTLDNLLKFDFDTAIPGHGPVATKADVQKFKEHMLTLHTRTRTLIRQGVTKAQLTSRLKVDDLGWSLDPTSLFVRNAVGGFYDELAKAR